MKILIEIKDPKRWKENALGAFIQNELFSTFDIDCAYSKILEEKDVDKLALDYFNKQWSTNYESINEIKDDLDLQAINDYKAGYNKALLSKNIISEEELDIIAAHEYPPTKHVEYDDFMGGYVEVTNYRIKEVKAFKNGYHKANQL